MIPRYLGKGTDHLLSCTCLGLFVQADPTRRDHLKDEILTSTDSRSGVRDATYLGRAKLRTTERSIRSEILFGYREISARYKLGAKRTQPLHK